MKHLDLVAVNNMINVAFKYSKSEYPGFRSLAECTDTDKGAKCYDYARHKAILLKATGMKTADMAFIVNALNKHPGVAHTVLAVYDSGMDDDPWILDNFDMDIKRLSERADIDVDVTIPAGEVLA